MISWLVFRGALIATAGWIVGDGATRAVFSYSPTVSAYAALVGWWFTAYLSAKFTLPASSSALLAVGYFLLFQIAAISGYDWFYEDACCLTVSMALGIGLVQSFVVSSPIMFDYVFRQSIRICLRKLNAARRNP